MLDRARRTIIVVVADFDSRSSEAIALARFGVRVVAVGLATADTQNQLRASGILPIGIAEDRDEVPWQAMDSIGGVDAVLITKGDWRDVKDAVWSKEIESAALSGRSTIPILDQSDSGLSGLRSARRWAAYTIARAWRSSEEEAKEIARNTRGYSIEDLITV